MASGIFSLSAAYLKINKPVSESLHVTHFDRKLLVEITVLRLAFAVGHFTTSYSENILTENGQGGSFVITVFTPEVLYEDTRAVIVNTDVTNDGHVLYSTTVEGTLHGP